jgi:hypothetical protein
MIEAVKRRRGETIQPAQFRGTTLGNKEGYTLNWVGGTLL